MNISITVDNFPNICRTCLKFADALISFTSCNIVKMLESCSSAKVSENDGLPNQICGSCFFHLNNFFQFAQMIEQSDVTLRNILNKHLLKTEDIISNKNKHKSDSTVKVEFELDPNDCVDAEFSQNDSSCSVKNEEDQSVDSVTAETFQSDALTNQTNLPQNNNGDKTLSDERPKIITENIVKTVNGHKITIKITRFVCPKCKFKTLYIHHLDTHLKSIHKQKGTPCSVCNKLFYHPFHLKEHQAVHAEENKSEINSQIEQRTNVDEDIKPDINKCEICNRVFEIKRNLIRHQAVHKSDKPFSCTQCENVFKSLNGVISHVQTAHLNIKKDDPTVVCKICGKQTVKSHMRTHLKTQHGDTREIFACSQCPKTFLLKCSLKIHVKTIHDKKSSMNFLCPECGERCISNSALKKHVIIHQTTKEWSCQMCPKKFKRKESLVYHTRATHLKVRRYSCSVCARRFFSNEVLARHMLIHTGEKPFKCVLCERPFRQKAALGTHMKLVHGIEGQSKINLIEESQKMNSDKSSSSNE